MKIALQADADLNPDIERGLRRREPTIDFRGFKGVIPDGTPDLEVLRIAADAVRVLVTRDLATMPEHFERFTATHESPGMILIPSTKGTGAAIEGLLKAWLTWSAEDLRNQIWWLP